ncbi:hypothetical protein ACWCP6_28600 [Streptomyces sp. NPDC002004]
MGWAEGGVLYRRWEDLRQARHAGWHGAANWPKAICALAALCLVIMTPRRRQRHRRHRTAGTVRRRSALGAADAHGLWNMVDHPIRTYLGQKGQRVDTAMRVGLLGVAGVAVYGDADQVAGHRFLAGLPQPPPHGQPVRAAGAGVLGLGNRLLPGKEVFVVAADSNADGAPNVAKPSATSAIE